MTPVTADTRRSRHRRVAVALIAALAVPSWVSADVRDQPALDLTPGMKHMRATRLINFYVGRYHYKDVEIDDTLSAETLDNYIESLDPNRSYFIERDVSAFQNYQYQFDDYLRRLELKPAYAIFDVFRTRVEERVEFALARLDREFDFSIDEDYAFDRRDEPWAADRDALDEIWRRRVKNDVLALRLAEKAESEITSTLRSRYQQLARRTGQLNEDDVYQIFINAYMGAIEPHTSYFSPRASDNFRIRMSLSLEGIGAVLQSEDDFTLVRRVVPGGPADISGLLHAGDRITGVGQGDKGVIADVIGWRLDDVVDLIRGPKSSRVRLQVLQDGAQGAAEIVTLTRDHIRLEEQAAKKSVLEVANGDGPAMRIGVIDLPSFYVDFEAKSQGRSDYRSTTRDVRRLLQELEDERVDGILIDLRGNGGGALTEATSLTGLFIRSGPIVQVRDARGGIEVHRDPDPDISYQGPLGVLVDRNSASASEIFAGAIQDYGRGLVIGEPTYGKGTVQNLFDLDRASPQDDMRLGQLKVTIQQFFRVSGDSTQRRGVVPDIMFPRVSNSDSDGERSFDNAIAWSAIKPAKFAHYRQPPRQQVLNSIRARHSTRVAQSPALGLLMEQLALREEIGAQKTVSLRESGRRVEQDERQQRRDRLEDALQDRTDDDGEDLPLEQQLADIVLTEAGSILADLIRVRNELPAADRVTAQTGDQSALSVTTPPATTAAGPSPN